MPVADLNFKRSDPWSLSDEMNLVFRLFEFLEDEEEVEPAAIVGEDDSVVVRSLEDESREIGESSAFSIGRAVVETSEREVRPLRRFNVEDRMSLTSFLFYERF